VDAGQRKSLLTCCSRADGKREALPLSIHQIIKNAPKRACEAHPGVTDALNHPLKMEFTRNLRDDLVEEGPSYAWTGPYGAAI
jgi:hypothetical protein